MAAPTPILAAVYRGKSDELATLLAAQPTLTLFEAAALGDAARVREIARAEPSALRGRSPDGWPALHLAAHFGHGDAVDALLAAGADVRALSDNHEANTALHASLAGRKSVRVVSALLARGADVNARGRRRLYAAAHRGVRRRRRADQHAAGPRRGRGCARR